MRKVKKSEQVEIKGIKLNVEQTYYYDEDNDMLYDDIELGNENLAIIRNAYRKETGLLLDNEIKKIRDQYSLNQRNFSLLLGFGEVTITRYESKMIQDKAHDEVIRSALDPKTFYNYATKNKELYLKYNSKESYENLIKIIKEKINGESIITGYIEYDEDIFLAVVKYIKSKIIKLNKTKLAKLLWYSDFKFFKEYNKSITGLTYFHYYLGAYPTRFDEKLTNNNIKIREEFSIEFDSPIYWIESCKSNKELSKNEKNIIDMVIDKFKYYNAKDLVEYMHNEDAYTKTKQNEIISYSYAKTISI